MSLLDLVAPGLGKVFDVIGTVVDRLVPDRNAAEKLKNEIALEVQQAALKGDLEQLEINKTEAASPSMFVAGGRPAFIWLCVATLAWTWLLAPMLSWVILAVHAGGYVPPLPVLGADEAQIALYGLLGLGAYRSVDKIFAQPGQITKGVGGILK
jgi:Holin of 3TMs, for gene-transfer release